MGHPKQRRFNKKVWIVTPIIIVLVLGLGMGAYAWSVYDSVKQTVNEKMHEPVSSINTSLTEKKMRSTEQINVLLLGVDERTNDSGRSDALLVMTLKPKENKIQLVSIPRDTRTMIIGKGYKDKINHAYAFGGADMSVNTVESFLDIELDYFVRINMEGLKELVDALGTITVQNDIAWNDGKYDFTIGPVEMDGDKTLHYVRMRKDDPAGDFGRTTRQRKVIEAIVKQGATLDSVTKINDLVDILGNNMTTSMTFDNMKALFTGYRNTIKNIESYQVKGSGTTIDNIYYYIVPQAEITNVHKMIAE
ncbi:Transcriptional regulator LytR [Paraliobacillus sp. PM-2]|uniref:LCP family glycopolymer transferase n=1 Tax=Paraliobacillus sp. PM-2 TaxID=1462524 RepID=UPI00061BCADA|nr:LCP family protein [Paraliobacillus sp. PM-2]CQR46317.1 Transcriptional regulator LytR [Paraliobacillus sp. PM-2]